MIEEGFHNYLPVVFFLDQGQVVGDRPAKAVVDDFDEGNIVGHVNRQDLEVVRSAQRQHFLVFKGPTDRFSWLTSAPGGQI